MTLFLKRYVVPTAWNNLSSSSKADASSKSMEFPLKALDISDDSSKCMEFPLKALDKSNASSKSLDFPL